MLKRQFGGFLCFSCLFAFFQIVSVQPALACTDFRLSAKDGSLLVGRSMEWGVDLKSQLICHPRRETVQSHAPGGKPGLKFLNSVDIPLEVLCTTNGDTTHFDYTQWMVIKDLTNRKFHYRSYADISLHTIDRDCLDFDAGAKERSCPIAAETVFSDAGTNLK